MHSFLLVINQNTEGFNTQKWVFHLDWLSQTLLKGTTGFPPPQFGGCHTGTTLGMFGQTIIPTEQTLSLTNLWKLLHFYNCSLCIILLLHFIISPNASAFCLHSKGDGWCTSTTVSRGGFFSPHNQFSANLMHLIFHILTRRSDIILLSTGGSSTARIKALQFPKEIILHSGSFNLSFFPLIFLLSDVYFYPVILCEKQNEERALLFLGTLQEAGMRDGR